MVFTLPIKLTDFYTRLMLANLEFTQMLAEQNLKIYQQAVDQRKNTADMVLDMAKQAGEISRQYLASIKEFAENLK